MIYLLNSLSLIKVNACKISCLLEFEINAQRTVTFLFFILKNPQKNKIFIY